MLFEGLHIPLTTPFHPDGRLNPRKLASNIARYSKSLAAGLIVLGPSAEPTLLSDDETREVLQTAAQAAAPEKILISGIARDSVSATLALADFAAALGYDAILLSIPSILAPESPATLRKTILYFQTIADRSSIPVILLSTPARSISLDTVAELAAHPNILGLLDSASSPAEITGFLRHTAAIKHEATVTPAFAAVTTRMKRAAATTPETANHLISANTLTTTAAAIAEPPPATQPLRMRTKTVGFQLIAASTPHLLEALHAGAVGIAPAFAACAPQACYETFAAWKDSDQPLAEEKQSRLLVAARLAEDAATAPGTLKFACDLNGYFGGHPRLPLLPPTGAQRSALEHHMKPIRN